MQLEVMDLYAWIVHVIRVLYLIVPLVEKVRIDAVENQSGISSLDC